MKKILVVASLLCLFACQHKQENKVESVDANTLAIDSLTNSAGAENKGNSLHSSGD